MQELKRLIFSVFLQLLFVRMILCQSYDPFVIEGAHWEMNEASCNGCNDGFPFPSSVNTHYFKIEGDTTINSIGYKKLLKSSKGELHLSSQNIQHFCEPWSQVAVLREDTIQKRVYIVGTLGVSCSNYFSTETLLFDFSLNVGDTSRLFMASPVVFIGCNDSVFVVDSVKIDSFPIYSISNSNWSWGKRRTKFLNPVDLSLSTYVSGYKLYEGLGPSFGLFGSPDPTFEGAYSTSLIKYCIGNDSVCGFGCLPTSIENVTTTSSFEAFPNPFNNKLTVINSEDTQSIVCIYNYLGEQIFQQAFVRSITIQTEQWSYDIYFCIVRTNNGNVLLKKLVKE